ncbi:MAG: ABC transporter substrate-binding protein [Desulfobacteraceae bacterium]|nr:ABC transporter substrate-binding protein [Desulfobacteraceae bacterium]
MKIKNLSCVFVLAAVTIALLLVSGPALAEGVLKIYTHTDISEMEKWAPAAEKAIGARIEWSPRYSSNELWSRVEAEAPNFQADMIWGFMNMQAMIGTLKDWFIAYDSPTWKDIPEQFKDPDGFWYGFNYWFAAAVVNTDLLKKKNLPKPVSWMDLTNPVYKGELVMPNPGTSGTAFLSVSAMMQIFGEEKGWELLEGLNKNAGQYTKSGSAPAKLVANGEYAVGISWDHAIYSRVEEGFPIEGIIPSEGTAYDLDSVAILKGCKNLEAAKKLMDWIGTEEAMKLFGQSRSKVTRPGVTAKVQLSPKLIKYNAVWAGENKNRIMSTWKERFEK